MEPLKNPLHEAFCKAFVENQCPHNYQIYLKVYPNSSKKAAYVSANRLLRLPKVKGRIDQLSWAKIPIVERAADCLSQSLDAKKALRIKGGYVEVVDYGQRRRAAKEILKYAGHLK